MSKENTLAQIHAAQDTIIDAMADPTLTPIQIKALQDASTKLRNMERSIVGLIGQNLINSLTTDSKALKNLAEKIDESAEQLSGVAAAVKNAATVVEDFIKIISTAGAAGLL
ncbi:MAG: hypothetical protein WC223_06060 [Bacteroidales bacterium]|jgi:dsDNA-specific endonuclease/ATPase MutS2